MDQGKPEGGQWTYDSDNRKKYPKDKVPPSIVNALKSEYHLEAEQYVQKNFAHHYGKITDFVTYPIDFSSRVMAEGKCRFHFPFGFMKTINEEHFLVNIITPIKTTKSRYVLKRH